MRPDGCRRERCVDDTRVDSRLKLELCAMEGGSARSARSTTSPVASAAAEDDEPRQWLRRLHARALRLHCNQQRCKPRVELPLPQDARSRSADCTLTHTMEIWTSENRVRAFNAFSSMGRAGTWSEACARDAECRVLHAPSDLSVRGPHRGPHGRQLSWMSDSDGRRALPW